MGCGIRCPPLPNVAASIEFRANKSKLNPPEGLPVGALSVGSLEATSDAP